MNCGRDLWNPPWTVLEAFLVILGILLSKWIFPFELFPWFEYLGRSISPLHPELGEIFLSALIRGSLFVFLIALFIKGKYRLPWRKMGLYPDQKGIWLKKGFSQGVGLFFFVSLVSILIYYIYPIEISPQPISEIILGAKNWREMILLLVLTSIIAPISEELYFRGFLYPALVRKWGRIPGLIIASSFFGLLHFDIVRFIPITLGGIWLTLLFEKTGSLYTSMAAHSIWNMLMTFLLFLTPRL